MNALDMTLCPLCGQPNNCAMELEKSTGKKQEPCWCVSVDFPRELLAQLPKDAAGCICNECVKNAGVFKNVQQSLTIIKSESNSGT